MADRLLREFYDENLALYLRTYHQQSGTVYHTVQQSAAGFKHATSMARPIYAHICPTAKFSLAYVEFGSISNFDIRELFDLGDKDNPEL